MYITANGVNMKTNKLPRSAWTDSQAAGSQSQQHGQLSTGYLTANNLQRTDDASNDASYEQELSDLLASNYSVTVLDTEYVERACNVETGYKKPIKDNNKTLLLTGYEMNKQSETVSKNTIVEDFGTDRVYSAVSKSKQLTDIPERVFMNGLIKHTIIALAIIVPLAAFSAYAAPQVNPTVMTSNATTDKTTTETLAIEPSAIIYKSSMTPMTVDRVDLEQYAGTWYEIGRLPMYFQRKCAGDVTATYTSKTDGSGIIVLNKCTDANGEGITAEGLAKPVDDTGSKLKVTFLPSWIRWLPVGRADYWVLARDADYKTALVGTPDNKYLWLLARSPNISQQTYAKYRQIAQEQGYDLKEFKLTSQTNQTVKLTP